MNATLGSLLPKNRVADSYAYDTAADPTWGVAPDRVQTYQGTYFDVDSVVNYYENADGQEIVALALNTNATHEPLAITTHAAWDFLRQFSRNADGSISVTP